MSRLGTIYEITIGLFIRWLITWFPAPIGDYLRYSYYRKRLRKIGRNVRISEGVEIQSPQYVSIGDYSWIDRNVLLIAGPIREGNRIIRRKPNEKYHGEEGQLDIGNSCHIAPNCVIQAHGGVSIGDFTGVASGARIYSTTHHYRAKGAHPTRIFKFSPMAPEPDQSLIIAPVVLEENTAVGLNSVVLPGVTIGKNSWVGILTWVVKEVPPDSIAIGNPASIREKKTE